MFRLFDFNILDKFQANAGDSEEENTDNEEDGYQTKRKYKADTFVIQMFGINELGETCSIFVDDFKPFFYILVNDDWTKTKKDSFIDHIKEKIGRFQSQSITASYLIKRKKLYGFDNGKEYKFVRIDFDNISAFNKTRNLWYMDQDPSTGERERGRRLNPNGFTFSGCKTRIYESNIPPILRFFHINEISPSGWIEIVNIKQTHGGRM